MYEHPYLITKVNEFEQQRLERDAERRRFIAEHPDQIVRREGAFVRMLRGMTRRGARAPQVATAPERGTTERGTTERRATERGTTERRATARGTELTTPAPKAADAGQRGVPAGCEPATAR